MKNGPYVNETGTIYQSFLIWQREGRYGRTLVTALILGLSFLCLFVSELAQDPQKLVLALLVLTLLGVALLWRRSPRPKSWPYLLVSRSGLEFHAHNYVLRSPWSNVVSVTPGREIRLREPALVGEPLYLNRGESTETLAYRIPLEMFHSGRGTELYYDLRRHVPHLCP
ncbi:MAG TPA: hypothetical protein VFS21_09465 [Roseiflexaceae bacterium]|nr:hypothetical protein [Roseiflexaceae bacterium]